MTESDMNFDFGDIELSRPHEMKLEEMMQGGSASIDGMAMALQQIIDQKYQEFDGQRRTADDE